MKLKTVSSKKLLSVALAVAVAALAFGSVQSTGALWRNVTTGQNAGTIKTGTLFLTAGTDTVQQAGFQFTDLTPAGLVQPGDFVQRPLVIKNSGNIPLKFRLGTAAVTSASAGVGSVHLDMRIVADTAACPTTGAIPAGTATLLDSDISTKGSVTGAVSWVSLASTASAVVCVRSTLSTAPVTQIKYNHVFTFQAQQAKNNP